MKSCKLSLELFELSALPKKSRQIYKPVSVDLQILFSLGLINKAAYQFICIHSMDEVI
jgi:hypothetical protein